MTPQEAIEIITNAIQSGNVTAEQDKALAMVQKALEKQIPKKSIEKEIDNWWSGMSAKTLSCPNCNQTIVNVWSRVNYSPKYCHYCGQALDWGVEK